MLSSESGIPLEVVWADPWILLSWGREGSMVGPRCALVFQAAADGRGRVPFLCNHSQALTQSEPGSLIPSLAFPDTAFPVLNPLEERLG